MANRELKFLLKHSSIYGIGTIVGQAVGFLLLPLYTRYLTPADYGVATLIDITMGLAGVAVGSGIANAMPRFYYDRQDAEEKNLVISTLYTIIGLFGIAVTVSLLACSGLLSNMLFHSNAYRIHFRVATMSLACGFFVDTGLLYLRVKNESIKTVVVSLTSLLLLIVFNIYFIVYAGKGLLGIFYSLLINRVIFACIITIPIISKIGIHFSKKLASNMIKFSFPLMFSNLFRMGVNESDKYFINFFFSPFETGIYTIANKIGTSIHILITSPFLQSFSPRRFEIMHQEDAKEHYALILNYYLLIIGTAGLCLSVFSSEIIRIMTTDKFYQASQYIPLIILAWIIFGMRYHFETGILIHKKTKYIAYINGFTAIVSLLLNYLFIPKFKIWGALIALNISQTMTSGFFYLVAQRLYPIRYNMVFILKLAIVSVSFALVSLLVSADNILISFILKIGIIFLYYISIRLIGLIEEDMLNSVKKAFVKVSVFLMNGQKAK